MFIYAIWHSSLVTLCCDIFPTVVLTSCTLILINTLEDPLWYTNKFGNVSHSVVVDTVIKYDKKLFFKLKIEVWLIAYFAPWTRHVWLYLNNLMHHFPQFPTTYVLHVITTIITVGAVQALITRWILCNSTSIGITIPCVQSKRW